MTDYKFVKAIKNWTEYYSPFCYSWTWRVLTKAIQNNVIYDFPLTHVTWITLNTSSITLTSAWQTYQLAATIAPEDATVKRVTWSSSDTSIATVDDTGLVTCVTPWNATITAETVDWWYTATCSVMSAIYIDFVVVWWWWGWASYSWWWGWWWAVCVCCEFAINKGSYSITVWSWWWYDRWWGYSYFNWVRANWWCWGTYNWAWWASWSWRSWWGSVAWCWYWWWWWAWWNWSSAYCSTYVYWWGWWAWVNWLWVMYWWGWGWFWWYSWWYWQSWWWTWGHASGWWSAANNCGWWGWAWWHRNCWWNGAWWLVKIRYLTGSWYNITWWNVSTSWDYTIHCFTSGGTLTVN